MQEEILGGVAAQPFRGHSDDLLSANRLHALVLWVVHRFVVLLLFLGEKVRILGAVRLVRLEYLVPAPKEECCGMASEGAYRGAFYMLLEQCFRQRQLGHDPLA